MLEVGIKAPDFELPDQNGKIHRLSDYTGKKVAILRTVVFGEHEMVLTHINWIGAMIFAIALFVLRKWKINPILVMSLCGVSRMMIHLIAGV